jgi:hypothetical protein
MNALIANNKITLLSGLTIIFSLYFSQNVMANENETACMENVQNKIAWNPNSPYETAQKWEQVNLEKLCKGTNNPKEPGKCFHELMTGHVKWGSTDKWEWKNAISLCAGTGNSDQKISCFKERIEAGEKWDAAIFQCQSSNSNLNNKIPN